MATTTATLTINSDINTDALALTTTHTLNKAGTTIGLEQSSGLAKKIYAAAQSNTTLISAGDYADNQAGKLYFKNTSTTGADTYILMEIGTNVIIGRLFPDDWMLIPFDGTEDIKATTSANGMSYEFGIFHEG